MIDSIGTFCPLWLILMCGTESPFHETINCALAVHVAWALIVCGWAPFMWQACSGTWDDTGLGCWPNWTPFGPIGCVLMFSSAPLRCFRPFAMVLGVFFTMLSAGILTYSPHISSSRIDRGMDEGGDHWLQIHNQENSAPALSLDSAALRIAMSCFWFASAALNGCAGADMLIGVARNAPPHHLHTKIAFWFRAITSVCGSLLCVVLVTLHMVHSIHFALENYAIGTVATALAWTIIGFTFSPGRMHHVMGTVSNGLSVTPYHAPMPSYGAQAVQPRVPHVRAPGKCVRALGMTRALVPH